MVLLQEQDKKTIDLTNACMLNGICGLMLRFIRLKTVAIVADIEKAFLQIGLQESHGDVTTSNNLCKTWELNEKLN